MSLILDLADLSFLDSESASVLCRLRREQNVTLEGLHLFIAKVIELTEAEARVSECLKRSKFFCGGLKMTSSVQTQFTQDFLQLLKETFEGPAPVGPSAFLNKGTGLFQTLDNISEAVASAQARVDESKLPTRRNGMI
jgi:hypothetical protein